MSTYFAKNLYFFAKLFLFEEKIPAVLSFFLQLSRAVVRLLLFFYLHSHFPGVQYQAGDE